MKKKPLQTSRLHLLIKNRKQSWKKCLSKNLIKYFSIYNHSGSNCTGWYNAVKENRINLKSPERAKYNLPQDPIKTVDKDLPSSSGIIKEAKGDACIWKLEEFYDKRRTAF